MQELPGPWRKGKGRGFLPGSSKEEVIRGISALLRRTCDGGYSHLCSETLLGQDSCYPRMMTKHPHRHQEDFVWPRVPAMAAQLAAASTWGELGMLRGALKSIEC